MHLLTRATLLVVNRLRASPVDTCTSQHAISCYPCSQAFSHFIMHEIKTICEQFIMCMNQEGLEQRLHMYMSCTQVVCPACMYIHELYHNSGRLSVGCAILDAGLRGGLLVPGLTEIAGTSGAGKTQLCLQLCLTVQLPREHGGLNTGQHAHILCV